MINQRVSEKWDCDTMQWYVCMCVSAVSFRHD